MQPYPRGPEAIGHLKSPLCEFMKTLKELLPDTKIFFQALLPIPTNECPFTAGNVKAMNSMIYNLCSRYKMYYINVFSAFLDSHGYTNTSLFPGYDIKRQRYDIHPNARGNGVLARFYIKYIYLK